MKKGLVIWLGALVMCVALLGVIGASLTKEKDQITIIQEKTYGDPSLAEGLTIWTRIQHGGRQFWEITHTLGQDGQTKVRSYDVEERAEMSMRHSALEPKRWFLRAGISSWDDTAEGFMERWAAGDPMVETAISYALTSSSTLQQISLKYSDYMDYYGLSPIRSTDFGETYSKERNTYVKLDGDSGEVPAFYEAWQQFFQISVIPGDQVEISVTKEESGQIVKGSMGTTSGSKYIMAHPVEMENGWLIGLDQRPHGVDVSRIPGGNGIYFMPVEIENGYRCAKPEKLSTVISLPEDCWVKGLYTDESRESLYAHVRENGVDLLKIYDLSTLEEIQVLDINHVTVSGGAEIYISSEFILVNSNLFWLYTRGEDGLYELKFRVPQRVLQDQRYVGIPWDLGLYDAGTIAYNGEYLLLGGWRFHQHDKPSKGEEGFYIALYDETGLVYCGNYKTSLNTGYSRDDNQYACQPDGHYDFLVEWK